MRSHESKDFLGGVIASLSIPWGFNKGDEDLGGYHLVWPRDLVETAFGLLAAGAEPDALRILRYLEVTQEPDGHWAQNMWLDGRPYWNGMQMDEAAFPILLVDMLRRHSPFVLGDLQRWWTLVSRAAGYILRNGPVTQQDRWEEDAGYSPFTLAVEISGLLAAADLADAVGQKATSQPICARPRIAGTTTSNAGSTPRTAIWHGSSESKATMCGSRRPDSDCASSPLEGFVPIKNRPPGQSIASGRAPDQSGLARAGAIWIAGAGRSANPEHGQSDRCPAQSESAAGPLLVPLQRRRLRRTRRRLALRRDRHRAALAACWPASAPTTNWRRDVPRPPKICSK